ncbi:RHS repeat-associated core domain-containing protein [Tahibacter sp. UC22_41]|uniref:RHS repeat-associated core domain-containing protein n=1 Tax=Tahibacter sp. UC22_41 TaxID=3350178 RepID=UPI0036DDE6E7
MPHPLSASPSPSTHASASSSPADAESPQQAVIAALLRGEDARAAIASARERQPAAPKAAAAPAAGAFAGYAQASDALRALLQRLPTQRNADTVAHKRALLGAVQRLQAQRLLTELAIDDDAGTEQAKRLSSAATTLAATRRQTLRGRLQRIDDAAQTLRRSLQADAADTPIGAAVVAELDTLLAADAAADAPAIYGANPLPLHRPRLPARDPVTTPAVVPSYANADTDVEPQPADWAEASDAPLSPAILEKARQLGNDYTRIADFVRSNVRTRWYAGAQQGAEATLTSLSGNDVDQASLLIALLRASRAPARYVQGVVEVDLAALAASLAVRSDKVGLALAAAGIAHKPVVRGGRIAAYAIEHTYVSAYLPMANYRGSSADLSGRTWIALAPALKPAAFTPARGALARTGLVAADFIDEHLNEVRSESPLQRLRAELSRRLAALTPSQDYADQLARHDTAATPLELLPASLPVPVLAVTGESAELPDSLRQHLRLIVRSGEAADAPVTLDVSVAVSALADRRVTLAYQPATIEDAAIVDAHGGTGLTPPYLYRVRPVLLIAGQPERSGDVAIDAGAPHRIEIRFDGPGGTTGFAQNLTAGGYAALAIDVPPRTQPADLDAATAGDNEHRGARLLAQLGARYLASWNGDDEELADLLGVGVVRPFPAAALVINQYRVDRVAGLATALRWRGVALDAALRPAEAFAGIDAPMAEIDWNTLSALQGSALEHRVFEQQWSVPSLSADKGLALARTAGIPIRTLNAASGSGGVHQAPAVLAAIDTWLAQGYVVDVPTEPVTLDAWSGAVWRVRSLSSGESGYFIAGQLAGGSTAQPPELWYLQDLVELLGDPDALPPNEDPLAAAILTIDGATQHQHGIAGQRLQQPLRVVVLDAAGHPVRRAAVTFRVTTGDSRLFDANGGGNAVVTVTTDARGRAEAPLQLAERQGTVGHFVLLAPEDPAPQWIGHATVDVSVATANGTLNAGEELIADILPAAPERLQLGRSNIGSIYFGAGYDRYMAQVTDGFDNPVANVPVVVSLSNDTSSAQCLDKPAFGPVIGAGLFAGVGDGGCPADEIRLTGHACTTPGPLQLRTFSDGRVEFNVAAPSHPSMAYDVRVDAAGTSATSQGQANPVDTCRSFAATFTASSVGYNNNGQAARGAKLGEVIASPYQFIAVVGMIEDGDSPHGTIWQPLTGGRLLAKDTPLQNGSLDSWHEAAPGYYEFQLRAGTAPGDIHGRIVLQGNYPPPASTGQYELDVHGVYSEERDDYSYGWAIDLRPPRASPDRIPLTPFGTIVDDFVLRSEFDPPQWQPGINELQVLADGEFADGCTFANLDYGAECRIRRGLEIEPGKRYTAKTVLENEFMRLESEPLELHFQQGIIAGYGIIEASAQQNAPRPAKDAEDLLGLLRGNFPTSLSVRQDVDVATGYVCDAPARLGYVLSQPAQVQIHFFLLDRDGNRTDREIWPHPAQDLPAGVHTLDISPGELPIGSYVYSIQATANGATDVREGVISSRRERHDALPLAHDFVKGVDLYSGGLVLSQDDIAVGGRGPGLRLTRTYASHAGDRSGFFGRGWSADLDMQVVGNGCGSRTVLGGAGQGQRFLPDGIEADGAERYRPQYGYHGSLLRRGNDYDFIAKDGTRYHFAEPDPEGPRLSYVEDTNGNRVRYTWERNAGPAHVTRLEDSAGRAIALNYRTFTVSRRIDRIDLLDTYTVVASALGPGGLRLDYDYDGSGNLVTVRRSDASAVGEQRTRYAYADYDGLFYSQPDGEMAYTRFGSRLTAIRDDLDGSTRRYAYGEDGQTPPPYWTGVQLSDRALYFPELRVHSITEPDQALTRLAYDAGVTGAVRGMLDAPITDVTDARNHPTTTRMNRYGASVHVTDPAGTTETTWDALHLQPATRTDALGGLTTFTYDDHGNRTSATVTTPHGTRRERWTYEPVSAFTVPHVTDRVAAYTDARDHVTTYTYDPRGNRLTTTRGGVTTTDTYLANGDRASQTDGNGKTWLFRYDAFGYPHEAQSPLGAIAQAFYDDRGRQKIAVDPNGARTEWAYDARDRIRVVLHPAGADGVLTDDQFVFDDAQRTVVHTDGRSIATLSQMDPLGRLLEERRGATTVSYRYDPNGNRTEQTDEAGHRTTVDYDNANRAVTRREGVDGGDVRITRSTFDALGHVLTETIGEGSEARRHEYRYDDPAYRRTHERRELVDDQGSRWIETVTTYDGNGNAITTTDALNRTTSRVFDDRDRLVQETAPLGKVTTTTYDGRDAVRTQTRSNAGGSGAQVRERRYDDDGRLVTEIDANGVARTRAYDAVGNLVQHSDGRGNPTTYRYDARRNRIEARGPEAGQLTTYGYDGNNNRISEQWANGRVLQISYDDHDRPLATTDNLGPVETRTYWPDGLLKSLADADGRTTYQFHDSLHRLIREELPGDMARTRTFTHTIHGEVLSETDPRGGKTQFAYDSLGRRTSITFPAVDGVSATVRTRYDAIGNVVEQTNARDQVTTLRYNDLNQKVEQVDPLDCSATSTVSVGNAPGKTAVNEVASATATATDHASLAMRATGASHTGGIVGWWRAAQRLVVAVMTAVSAPVSAHDDSHASPESQGNVSSTAVTATSIASISSAATPTTAAADVSGTPAKATTPLVAATHATNPTSPAASKAAASPAAACTQTWTYDSESNVLTQIDRRGITTTNTYDRENRLLTQAKAGLTLQTVQRDPDGNVQRQTDALGRPVASTYDKANRKLSEDRSGLAIDRWTYTPLGDVATHTDADGRTTTNTYTARRFLATESLAGETSRYTYDGSGHRTTQERPNGPGSTWTYAYDAAGNLASVTDPDDHATAFGYDANNNRTRITDANDHVTTFAYDARNRLAGKTYPGGSAWTWRYDGDNNRLRSEAPNGRIAETDFDALNRPIQTTYLGAPAGEVQSTAFAYDGNGNVRTITETSSSGTRVETRDYDDFDRLVHAIDGDGRPLHYAYDDVGNRTRLTDPDGHDTVWTYNALNQNTRVSVPGLGTTTLGYAPSGRLTAITRPDGSLTEHTYFDNGRLQTLRHSKAGATLARYDYVYDPNGNRTEQRELNGQTTADTTQSTRYVYDDADRLVEVKEPNRTTTYTLDPAGNRIQETVVDGDNTAISQSTLTYNNRDQLTGRSDPIAGVNVVQTWDSNGNLATQTVNGQPPRVYSYDARDRLVGLTLPTSPSGPATLAFAYHPDGLRREKTDGVTTTRYHYDGQSLLAETNTLGNTLRQFHYSATQLIAQTQAGTTPTYRHVLLDALRSPIALLDPAGLVTARTSYDAFGEIRAQLGTSGSLIAPNRNGANAELASTDNQPIGFTGYLKDSESGLYYAKARYYDPATARFTTEDPEAGKDLEPPSLHRYLYAYANPTVYTDPDGRQVCMGHGLVNCPLPQWTSPNRPVPQNIAGDALNGLASLSEVDADRTEALPSSALPTNRHLNTSNYTLVPYVDPDGAGKGVRYYDAVNNVTGQSDWTVPPRQLDAFVKDQTRLMNIAAYSRTFGGTTESNVHVQRMLRDALHGNYSGAASNLAESWEAALSDPTFYVDTAMAFAGGVAAKSSVKVPRAGPVLTRNAAQATVAEAADGKFVRFSADYDSHIPARDYSVPSKRGIGGAHNIDEFYKYSNEYRIVKSTDHPTVDGVSKIKYQMAARDSAGNPTGEYRKPMFDKTLYDPRKITDEQYLAWGRQAAAEAQSRGPLSREWTGFTPDGIKFMGYLDETGAVKSFFPEY